MSRPTPITGTEGHAAAQPDLMPTRSVVVAPYLTRTVRPTPRPPGMGENMTGSTNRDVALHELEDAVRAELSSTRDSQLWMPPTPSEESMYDQQEAQREEIGLRNLLGAVQAVDRNDPMR